MLICPNLSNKDVAREFNELKSALMAADPKHGEAMAYLVWSLNNGNAIDKAPNGAESLLFKSLVDYYEGNRSKAIVAKAKTYSTNFLKWFGDWTGEKKSLSETKKQNPYSSEITIGKASPDYDSADMNGAGAMFAIRKNGEYIGSIAVNAYYRKGGNIEPWGEKDTNYVSMSSVGDAVEIEKEFRGKGYGKAAYFEFAKLMADLGYILRSAPSKSRTESSTRVWKSLVRDGYAKQNGDRYEFINSSLQSTGRSSFKTIDAKNNLFTPTGEVNWNYFELLLDLYHNNQPDSMFSHGRYTLATRPENHFTGEKNTLNHIKFVTQSMLNLLEGKYDVDLPFVSEARASMQNQKDLMIIAAMFHDVAKPYRHGDIHGWESADILRDLLGIDYNNRVAEWAVRHHMPMPFSHKAEFSLSNPEAIEVAKNIARDARRIGIDANTAINAFVLINAADVINGRELNVDDNWAKKAGEEGLKKYGGDISVKNVLSVELKEKVALLKKAFDEIKDEDFGDTAYNYSHQERFDYQAFPEGGREDKKLPYLNNAEYTGVSKVVDENGEPLVVWHGSRVSDSIEEFQKNNTFFADRYTAFSYTPFDAENEMDYMYPVFLSIKNPKLVDANGKFWNNIDGKSTDDIAKSLSENDGAIIVNLKDYSDFTPGNPELSANILEEAPLHTDYITSSPSLIKHIDNRDGEYTGPNIYHNLQDEDGNYEDEVPEVFSPFPEYDEEAKLMFLRLHQLQSEFEDLKQRRSEINKKLNEAKADTISRKTIIVNGQKIRFVEKPNHLVFIDNDERIFGLVTTKIQFEGDTIEFPLLFPFERIFDEDINYNRIDNSIKNNTVRLVYEALSVLKNNGKKIVYSPWYSTFLDVEHKNTAGNLKKRMSKLLGIDVQDFITSEEKIVEDYEFSKYFGSESLKDKTLHIKHFRLVFNIDTMLNRLAVLGHNKEIYDILDHIYNQPSKTEDNSLLVKALLSEEKDIDEKQTAILQEIENLNSGIRRKESELSGLPFNITQGSLIWLVLKYINEGMSRDEIKYLVELINYENGSSIKINWKTLTAYGEKIEGTDDIKRTTDRNVERIKAIVNYLNKKFGNKIEVYIINENDWLRNSKLYDGSNSCIIGDVVYLRESRMTTEIAAEEMLHVLIHGMHNGSDKLGNKLLFDNLFEKAKQQFPRLWLEIQSVYKYNLEEELVTQVLARYFNRDFDKRDSYKIEDLIDKFKNWFVKLFKDILDEFAGIHYATVGDINPLVDFLDISDMLLAKNLKFDLQTITEIHESNVSDKFRKSIFSESEILHNISARQQAAQDEANRIIVRMNVLYKQYEKMKSKTPSQERLANQIFETLNKLKLHRDISAVQIALDQAKLTLGQYDPATNGPAQISSIYKYLYDAQQNGFSGVSPQSLVDMYRNSIKFYKDLIDNIPSELAIDLTPEDKNSIADLKSLIDNHIMPIWTLAIMTVGDQIIDDLIDSEVFSSAENKEDMKKVAKDWLHKNLMYGDITAVTSYVYNYSNSSNPIIKQAFHLILAAEQKTLEEVHGIAPKLMKAYQKANSGVRSLTSGWLSIMMEFDDKGIPTGNFVRDLNYGLYQKDLKEFLEQLNDKFMRTYKFTYVVDDTGAVTNSLTGEFAEDEEWGPNGEMPKYIEYLREIEYFKADRVHRRYQPRYYLERLSKPYDGTIDPMDPKFVDTRFNHGLSPKTLARYTYYQSNINYYLNKCQDLNTGLVYPERLSYDDQLSLDRWKERMDRFTSLFDEYGAYKVGEDLKMAYEVRAWQKWTGEHTNSDVFQDDFNKELARVKQEAAATGNPRIYNDFVRYNSRVGINPDYIKQTVGDMRSGKSDTDTSFRGKLLRASLQSMVNNPHAFNRELQRMANNPLFWLHCKASDQAIEDANDPDNQSGWPKDKVEAFQLNFYQKDILYIDEHGFYIDENGNKVNPTDPSAKGLEDAGKLLTFRQWLINKYTDEALRTGSVAGLIDESTGASIDFSGLTQTLIRSLINNLLSYKKTYWDEDGNVDRIEDEPLTIFLMLAPNKDKFFNKRTNREEPTIIVVGDSRFKDSHSSLQTPSYQFDPNAGISEIPNKDYADGRYDNSEAYNKVMRDDSVRELYELLVQTMLDMQQIYSTNRKFNYKLPQINAHTSALFSRILKRGYSAKAILGMWNSITQVEENDELLRTKQDYFIGVDGEVANDVPLKFIRDLKNKEDLSTDLVSSVILFADMALNYKNKTEVDSKLKILRYNMDKDIRDVYESKLKPRSELSANNNDNSIKMFDSMMDVSMYGNKFGNTGEGGPSKTRVALHKTADMFLNVESVAMLGLNMFSMSVGFADSITRILSESAAGKYMTVGDCLWGLAKCLYYTPACIKNMFNPLANNKMTALMQMNGISKGTFGTYVKADWGKGRKLLSNILMGGWSMLDWMANALLMMAFYHNCRLYEGTEIPKGFYTKYEMELAFLAAGKTKAAGKKAFHNYTNLGCRITLWDAYDFKNGLAFVKPEYEQYVTQRVKTNIATKTKKRGALYNGMNPDNDVPRWKRDVIGRLAGALRAWIIQQVQHLIAGGTDNIERTFSKVQTPEVTTSGTRMKTKYVKDKLTDEQRSRRMAWDYETGTPQDQILTGLFRSFKTLWKASIQALMHKPKTAKLSEVEKYAWKDTIIFLAMLSMMMVGWTFVHDWARDVPKPTSRKLAGPASMLNPVDYYEYVRDVYIPNQYWKLAVDDIYFRTVEAKISSVNVQQVLDIVNALTALKSGFDNQFGIIELSSQIIGDEDEMSGILKQGGYKFYTKGEKALYKAVGPVNNLHTFLTYYGATGNLRWYTNKFGKVYRAFGYDFKTKDKEKEKQNVGFSGGNFSSGNFGGGNFSGGNFSK